MQRTTCLVCGAIVKSDFTYCSYCGTLLNKENKFLEKEEILIQAEKGSLLDLTQDLRTEMENAIAQTIIGFQNKGRREFLEYHRNGTVERLQIEEDNKRKWKERIFDFIKIIISVLFLMWSIPYLSEVIQNV